MKRYWKIGVGVAVAAALVYLYYTEVKPVVIFGLRDDYARPIDRCTFPGTGEAAEQGHGLSDAARPVVLENRWSHPNPP